MKDSLSFGARGPQVADLADLLAKRGYPPLPPITAAEPKFGRAIENMVLYFQMTHQGPDGDWLDVDGKVGEGTWWALKHHTGDAQRSFFREGIPDGIEGDRRSVLEAAIREHGVREDPRRPNRGNDVDKYLPKKHRAKRSSKGQPWCCYFVSWVTGQVMETHPLGGTVGSCYGAWARARRRRKRMWEPNDGREPTPGDAFLLFKQDPENGRCPGHIGFVLQVSEDGRWINTVEGNCGNRVKIGKRSLDDRSLRGFINFYRDYPPFARGMLRGARNVGRQRTR